MEVTVAVKFFKKTMNYMELDMEYKTNVAYDDINNFSYVWGPCVD